MSLSKIDAVEEYISSLIQNKQENEFVDFKQFYYHEDKKYDLIKDIVSFSNEVTSVDKYIVFGIINGSWEPAGINLSTMPDVSVINDLLHTYVEPFIYVEIGQMKYNGKDLGYIKIPVDRADRPYVIKKEYSKHGKTYLRYGEIYVRKGANNFIATRRDLDHIYRNNGAFLISVFDSTVDIGFVQIRNERKLFIQVRTILANNTSHSINICGGVCDISTSKNTAQYECIYCEDRTRKFSNVPSIISTVPLSFSSGMIACKNSDDRYFNGYKVLLGAKMYHTKDRTIDVSNEIYGHLCNGKIVILDLSVGNAALRDKLSKKIAAYIFNSSMDCFTRGETPPNIVLYIEEAHNLIGKENKLTDTWPRIAKEGAKYRISLVYATQEVSSVHPNILANTENWIVSHINSEREVRELAKFYDFSDFSKSLLRSQDVGFSRVKTLSSPFVVPIQIDKFDPERIKRERTSQ